MTLYVAIGDPQANDDACAGRGTEALPYRSISAAIKNAPAGSTIRVKPGVYANDTPYCVSEKYLYTQLYVDKKLRIESTGGKDATIVEGCFSDAWRAGTPNATRWGEGASRCVMIAESGKGTVLKGFTFRNGGTCRGADNTAQGGGVLALANAYVADSVISNCCSQVSGAAMEGGTAIRCLVAYNFNVNWPGGMVQDAKLWNCVLRETQPTSSCAYCGITAVNCTFLADGFRTMGSAFFNSLVEYGSCKEDDGDGNVYDHTVRVGSLRPDVWDPQTLAPMFLDVRLLPFSSALNAGATANLRDAIAIPDEFAATDYGGHAINYASATCHAGASQETAEPAGGAMQIGSGAAASVDGQAVANGMYAFPTVWPMLFRVRSSAGTPCYASVSASGCAGSTTCQPDKDDVYHLLPPAETNRFIRPFFTDAHDVLWVDAGADSSSADGSEAHPYPTIQEAVDACSATRQSSRYSVIFVRPGEYASGGRAEDGITARVHFKRGEWNNLSIRSTGGAAVTTIRGGAAVCGVRGSGMFMSGFTIAGCSGTAQDAGGVAAFGVGLYDCVITGCAGNYILRNSSLERCSVFGNTAVTALFRGANAYFTAFYGNTVRGLTHGDAERLNFCAIAGNDVTTGGTLLGNPTYCQYCAIDANWAECATRSWDVDTVLWHFSYWDAPDNYWYADPCFVNVATGDLRMTSASPGYASARLRPSADSALCLHMSADLGGLPVAAWPVLSAGCYQMVAPAAFAIKDPYGCVTVEGASRWDNVVECGLSRTFTIRPAPSARQKITAYVVTAADGTATTNRVADLPDGALTLTVSTPDTAVTVDVLTARRWYVDAERGNDKNAGLSAVLAKRTFSSLTNLLQSGDTVYALPGTYDEGCVMEPGTDGSIYSRAVIPEGVAFVSTGGKAVTFITGANAEEPGPEARDVAPFNKYGVGLRATRCVYMGKNSRLQGFTLTGGRTYVRWTGSYDGRIRGAGVKAVDRTARVVDCDFTDCVGLNGAAAFSGTLVNCRAIGCGGLINGSDASHLFYAGPTLVNVLAYGTPDNTTYSGKGAIYNSTLVGAPYYTTINNGEGQVTCYNSLIYGNCPTGNRYYNCVLASNGVYQAWSGSAPFAPGTCCENCAFPAVKDVPVDGAFKPTSAGAALLVNAGDNALMFNQDADTSRDLAGGLRVRGGAVDIGAYEWEPRGLSSARGTRFFIVEPERPVERRAGYMVATGGYALPKSHAFVPVMDRLLYSHYGSSTGMSELRKARPDLAIFDHPWMEAQFTLRQNDIQSWTDPTPPDNAWTKFPTRISEVLADRSNVACMRNIVRFEKEFPGHPYTLVAHGSRPVSILKQHFDTDFTDFMAWRAKHPSFFSFCAFDEYDSLDWEMNAVTDPEMIRRRDDQYLPMTEYVYPRQRTDVDYEKVKSFYFGSDALYGLWSASLTAGHNIGRKGLKFLFYEAEHGSTASPWRWGGLYARGAARQFRTPFGWYSAMFTNNSRCRDGSSPVGTNGVTNLGISGFIRWPNPGSPNPITHLGSSRSLVRRNVRYGYFIGNILPTIEGGTSCLFATAEDGAGWTLSPYGEDFNAIFEWDRRHDRGTVYTPVAFLSSVDENLNRQCCNSLPAKDEGSLPAFLFTLLPSYVANRALYCDPASGFEGCMWNSEFGEIADMLCPDAGPTKAAFLNVLRGYKAAFLIGYHDPKTCPTTALSDYVRKGGTLLCSYDQVVDGLVGAEAAGVAFGAGTVACGSQLLDEHGAVVETVAEPYTLHLADANGAVPLLTDENGAVVAWLHAFGRGNVITVTARRMTSDDFLSLRENGWQNYQWWNSPVYARLASGEMKMPIIHYLLRRVQDETMPIRVTGDIQWGLNKTAKGWMLWLINNKGVTKFAFEPEDLDPSAMATVTVDLKDLAGLTVSDVTDVSETLPIAVQDGRFTVQVGPGEDRRIAIE